MTARERPTTGIIPYITIREGRAAEAPEVHCRANEAGWTIKRPVWDQFWGDRYCQAIDPFDHEWGIASKKERKADG